MIRRLLAGLLLCIICMLAVPLHAHAFDPFGRGGSDASVNCADGSNEQKSTVCQTTNANPIAGPDGVLVKLTHVIAVFAGAVAIIMIIYAGFRYVTSGSDVSTSSRTDTDIAEAKNTLISAIIGLIVIVLAQAIITYVVSRL